MDIPILDRRTSKDILAQMQALAPRYVPEWKPDGQNPDAALALIQIFADMMEGAVRRFNRMPQNHYLTFLNMAGARLRPAVSSQGMVTVAVTPGSGGVHIEKGSALYAPADNAEGRVFFATEDAMYALDGEIKAVAFTDPEGDRIVMPVLRESGSRLPVSFTAFDWSGPNLQEHALYIAAGDLLRTEGSVTVRVQLQNTRSLTARGELEAAMNADSCRWHYFGERTWLPVEDVRYDGASATLTVTGVPEECEIEGITSRFLRCTFVQRPESDLKITGAAIAPAGENVNVDALVSDTAVLPEQGALPYGERFAPFTDFYIGCSEAFTKPGALIDLKFDMDFRRYDMEPLDMSGLVRYKLIMHPRDFLEQEEYAITIERVVWEYWNGAGWARLLPDDEYEDFFKVRDGEQSLRHLRFQCPTDIAPLVVGAKESHYIRARIIRVNNAYKTNGFYVCPYLHTLKVDYGYTGAMPPAHGLVVRSDMQRKVFGPEHTFLQDEALLGAGMGRAPAMYICLNRPVDSGPVRIYLDIKYRPEAPRFPLRWEYFSRSRRGELVWDELEVQDGTDGLRRSGILTLIGERDFCPTELLGQEGFFIRAICPAESLQVGAQSLPQVDDVHLNTVRVVQMDTPPPEFFRIESREPLKVCQLAFENLLDLTVWVNELGQLSVDEEAEYLAPGAAGSIIEREPNGRVSAIWVKWRQVDALAACGPMERVFEADMVQGTLRFGDGRRGRIPASQQSESIRVDYTLSQGKTGNVDANLVGGFAGAVPYIDRVSNLYDILGGVDAETVGQASRRMGAVLGGMGRLITQDDIEQAIVSNVHGSVRARCLLEGERLRIAVLPENFVMDHVRFEPMEKKVRALLRERGSVLISGHPHLMVCEPNYVEVAAQIGVKIRDMNLYQDVYLDLKRKLDRFLDPIHGNFDGGGWPIGHLPRREIIYNYLKTTDGIQHIEYFYLFAAQNTAQGRVELDYERIDDPLAVPVPGEHIIKISVV